MASITLLPSGDNSVGLWTDASGGTTNIYQGIDEGISAANDTDYVKAPNNSNNADYSFTIGSIPGDFGTMTDLSFNVRYREQNRNNDTLSLSIAILNGTTVLAAANSSGTFSVIDSSVTNTSFTNSGVTAFAYVETTSDSTIWSGAIVTVRQGYTKSGPNDNTHVEISAIEITGDYATQSNTYNETGSGGIQSSGDISTIVEFFPYVDGGQIADGTSLPNLSYSPSLSGGSLSNGASIQNVLYNPSSSGGVFANGVSTNNSSTNEESNDDVAPFRARGAGVFRSHGGVFGVSV